jgi:hypothetical protein
MHIFIISDLRPKVKSRKALSYLEETFVQVGLGWASLDLAGLHLCTSYNDIDYELVAYTEHQ